MIINSKKFEEISSRGVSQKTWDKMDSTQRNEYIKNNPTSRYAEKINKQEDKHIEPSLHDLEAQKINLEEKKIELENSLNDLSNALENIDKQIQEVKLKNNSSDDYNYITDRDEIEALFKSNMERSGQDYYYSINGDGSVDIVGDFWAGDIGLLDKDGHFKIKFNKVRGFFDLDGNEVITSLEGCPKNVLGSFDCYKCPNLRSLKGAPKNVAGNFIIRGCEQLFSLQGLENTRIDGKLDFKDSNIENWADTLEGEGWSVKELDDYFGKNREEYKYLPEFCNHIIGVYGEKVR